MISEPQLCQKHGEPLIWGRERGRRMYKHCTRCLDEEWEIEFAELRNEWRNKSEDEMMIEIGLFYEWMIRIRYSTSYARSKNRDIKYLLKHFKEKNIELSKKNIISEFSGKSKQVIRNYISAFNRFMDFKNSLKR